MKAINNTSRLKKLLITAGATSALILGTSAVIHAGHHKGGHSDSQRSGQMQQRVFEKLDLSEAQKTQIENIRGTYKPQMQALREAHKSLKDQKETLDPASSDYVSKKQAQHTDRYERSKSGVTLRAQMQHEIALVLTEEQRAEMATLKAERKAKMQERRGQRGEKRQQHREKYEQK